MPATQTKPEAIDWPAMRDVYLRAEALDAPSFEILVEKAILTQHLPIPGFRWSITHQILSANRDIPLRTHCEALAAASGFKFRGIQAFHEQMVDSGLLPPWSLNVTHFHRVPKEPLKFGELAQALGLLTATQVHTSLGVQRFIEEKTQSKVALGSIILALNNLSYPDFYQLLGIQAGIPYRGLDESAAEIFDTLGRKLARK